MKITKISLIVAIAGIVAISQAQTFTTYESGNFTGTNVAGTSSIIDNFTVNSTQSSSSLFSFTSGSNDYSYNGNNISGVFTLIGPTAADSLTFDYTSMYYYYGDTSESELFAAQTVCATGIYSGLSLDGNGTDHLVLQNSTNFGLASFSGTTSGSFTADVEAVPAPAGIFALALGGLGLLIRRRRS